MLEALYRDMSDPRGRDELKEIIQGRGAAGCVTTTYISGGGEIVPQSEGSIGFFVTMFSDVSVSNLE
jgi:hypothetical protein